jgi:RNA polymerase sigma factor (sigma-70 family)
MSLHRLLVTLNAVGLEPMALEVAETLWLAQYIEPIPVAEAVPHLPTTVQTGTESPRSRPVKRAHVADQLPTAPLHVSSEQTIRSQASMAIPIRVPTVKALPQTGLISRELRPLNRRSPSRRDIELDEQATAQRSAEFRSRPTESRKWQLVRRPVQDRWLDLMVIVDVHPSMIIWKALVEELCVLLEQQGAFEDVRVWYLHHPPGSVGLSPVPATTQRLRAPTELVDPTGRRLTLFISDMVAPNWDNGEINMLVERCAHYGPTAVLQPLPERLWSRTALRPRHGRIHSLRPGGANRQFRFVPRTPDDELPRGTIPVPVLEITAASMGSWARLVTAGSSDGVDATVIGIAEELSPELEHIHDPHKLLAQFRASASPQAFRLMRHLAAAPLSLPVMRLVQCATSSDPDPSYLAEVYLSGLLERTDAEHPDAMAFEFVPGVRDVLTGTLRRAEALKVLDTVSRIIAPRFGVAQDFTAYVPIPGQGGHTTTVSIDSFAVVANNVLERMGVLRPGLPQVEARRRQTRDHRFEDLIKQHVDKLYSYFRKMLGDSHQAEDAVQEVFSLAIDRYGSHAEQVEWDTMMLDRLARQVLSRYQRQKAQRSDISIVELEEEWNRELDSEEYSFDLWAGAEWESDYPLLQSKQSLWDTMTAALEGISPKHRWLMTVYNRLMQEGQRVTGTDLAAELEMTPQQVSRELHRARNETLAAIQALVVARTTTCPAVREVLNLEQTKSRRDIVLDRAISHRITQHLQACDICAPIAREAGTFTSW